MWAKIKFWLYQKWITFLLWYSVWKLKRSLRKLFKDFPAIVDGNFELYDEEDN